MSVFAHEKRTVDSPADPIVTDRLGGGEDVVLREGALLGSSAMPARAEMHPLLWVAQIRMTRVVAIDELVHVDQQLGRCRLAGQW